MNIFRLDVNSQLTHKISIENLEVLTKRIAPWFQQINGHEGWFAVCPGCSNPIQIVGLMQEKHLPYGKHFIPKPGNVEYPLKGIVDTEEMEFCRYYVGCKPINKGTKRRVGNPLSIAILRTLIEQFDRVIYLLEKCIGIKISVQLAKLMLEDYIASEGWRYRGATLDNIPWAFAHMSAGRRLFGRIILDKNLANEIKQINSNILIDESGKISGKVFLDLTFCFILHKQKLVNNQLEESIDFVISDGTITVYSKTIKFDHEYFRKLIHSPNQTYRKLELVELAKNSLGRFVTDS